MRWWKAADSGAETTLGNNEPFDSLRAVGLITLMVTILTVRALTLFPAPDCTHAERSVPLQSSFLN